MKCFLSLVALVLLATDPARACPLVGIASVQQTVATVGTCNSAMGFAGADTPGFGYGTVGYPAGFAATLPGYGVGFNGVGYGAGLGFNGVGYGGGLGFNGIGGFGGGFGRGFVGGFGGGFARGLVRGRR
jgi:hypothetical protein